MAAGAPPSLGTRGRPLTDFGRPPPASSPAAPVVAPPGATCAAAILTWHARSFAPLASAMGATPPPAHLPERRACSCEGPKKAHRNLVGLRRTASRSPRSVLSARASSRSFITAIGVGRRDFTVWTGRQRALLGPGLLCPAPYAGWSPSLPKRIGRTEVRSPRPFRALVALAGRNLPPLCSPPRRRAGLSAMAQIERAYATCPTTLVVPLASTHATRCSQHHPPFALVQLLLLRCCSAGGRPGKCAFPG